MTQQSQSFLTQHSPAFALHFRKSRVCVWMWACVAFRRGFKTRLMDTGEKHRATLYRWRKGIAAQLDYLEERAESVLSPELLERGLTEAE